VLPTFPQHNRPTAARPGVGGAASEGAMSSWRSSDPVALFTAPRDVWPGQLLALVGLMPLVLKPPGNPSLGG
jgi:hypothetical protein